MSMDKLLVIDDESDVAGFIGEAARQNGFDVKVTTDAGRFKSLLDSFKPSVIVLDLMMPELDGIEIIRFLADKKCNAGLVLISGMDTKVISTAARLAKSLNLVVLGTLQKPVLLETLESIINLKQKCNRPLDRDMLQSAITNHEFCVYYQPQLTVSNGQHCMVKGVEALVRWNHPELGFLPPCEFIPLAEECGLIGPLTEYVLEESLLQVNHWHTNHNLDLDISVNLASQLLSDTTLPDRILQKLNKLNVKGSKLILEITETGLTEDLPTNVANLARFRVNGIDISIDDFGTGYSSLVLIYRMPFNELKIDRSFVMDIDDSKEARTIIKALIELAHNLGLKVCAEGIETESAFSFLYELGCDLGQGYFFSPPIPGDQIPACCEKLKKQIPELKKIVNY